MYFILALAAALRLILINQSLWLDEAIEALALMGRQGPLLQYALADFQPPLYHFLAYATTYIFGFSEPALRLPSLLAGIATVYFVMKIGRELGNRWVSWIVGLLAATNPLLIYYAQEGRTYALTTLCVTASFYYLLRLLKQSTSARSEIAWYLVWTIAMVWTSYLSWFVVLAQGIYALTQRRFDLLRLQAVAAATLLLWLPGFLSSLNIGQSTRVFSPEWGRVVGGLTWKSLPLTWVKFAIGRLSFDNKILYAAVAGLFAILHLALLKQVNWQKSRVLLWWIIPPVLLGILTATILPVYQYFRVMFVLPGYLLLLALGVRSIKTSIVVSLIISLQLICLGTFWLSPQYHREDWRSLAETLKADASATVAMPSRAQSAPLLYYAIPQTIIEPTHEQVVGEKVYYIRYVEDLFDTGKVGQANLTASGYTMRSQMTYSGIQVDIYEHNN